jgi:hypothetical protein
MPGVKPVPKAAGAATAPAPGLVAGTGPGVHSPDSPFAPLPARADVVPWSVLTSVKTKHREKPHPAGVRAGAIAHAEPENRSASRAS